MSIIKRFNFQAMSFVHDTLYSIFRNPNSVLKNAGLKPGQTVLEVGCGPGFFTIPASRIVGEEGSICTIDINPLAIERVQEKIEKEKVNNVKTILADAADTGLMTQSFDLIFLFGFANPKGEVEKMWLELHRLLKSRGTLSIEGRLQPPKELFRSAKHNRRIHQFRKM